MTYLVPPKQVYMGAKSVIGTHETQTICVPKEKLVCSVNKCMVSMTTVNAIL